MLIEDLISKPSYDIARLEKARKKLARDSGDFYITNGRLEILIRLMAEDPTSPRINELISELPWKPRTYIMSKVIRIMPDGTENPKYRPGDTDRASSGKPLYRMPQITP